MPHGLVFKAHRLVYHSTLGWRVMKMKKKSHMKRGSESLDQVGGEGGRATQSPNTPEVYPVKAFFGGGNMLFLFGNIIQRNTLNNFFTGMILMRCQAQCIDTLTEIGATFTWCVVHCMPNQKGEFHYCTQLRVELIPARKTRPKAWFRCR